MKYANKHRSHDECEKYAKVQQLPDSERLRRLQRWHRGTFGSEYRNGYADGFMPGWLSGARHQLRYAVQILLTKHLGGEPAVIDALECADDIELARWFDALADGRVPDDLRRRARC